MADKVTTEDCKEAISDWYDENEMVCPGEFKRVKKYKDEQGQVVRLFEHKPSDTLLKVVEKDYLDVSFANALVGKNYLFAFCENETYGEEEGFLGFAVVEKNFFKENNCLDSVHFTTTHDMPEYFDEEMESVFAVEGMSKEQIRKELLSLGFTESKELEALLES